MTHVLVDTHRVMSNLKSRGFSEDQAEGITDALRSLDMDGLTSKSDLAQLETRLTVRMATFLSLAVAAQSMIFAAIEIFMR